jgi:predicted nucleic acid-binding protein
MKKLFIDTNIMMDLLCERDPFYNSIAKIATLSDKKELELFVSALSFATTSCFLTKNETIHKCKEKLRKFKSISTIVQIDETIIDKSLNSNFNDFQDSLQYYSAIQANCDIIITRNGKDFKLSEIPVLNADEFLISIKRK